MGPDANAVGLLHAAGAIGQGVDHRDSVIQCSIVLQWDLTAKYRISERLQTYAEIANLGDEPEYYYSANRGRILQYDEFGTTAAIGVQYNL